MEGDGNNIPPPVVEGAGAGTQQAQQGQVVLGNDGAPVLPLVVEQPAGGLMETKAHGDQEGLEPGNVETQPLVVPPDKFQSQGDEGDSIEHTRMQVREV